MIITKNNNNNNTYIKIKGGANAQAAGRRYTRIQ